MVAWVWVAVAALAIVTLQAFLFHRARQTGGVDSERHRHEGTPIDTLPPVDTEVPERVDDGVRCPHCGEHNEPDFAFCQQCVQRIE